MSAIVRTFGRVKWFNNKAGYGFITVIDGPTAGSDLFAHHSSIKIASEQYKYLVQGEYVEFTLSTVASGDHETQAADITGIRSGLLMCETRAAAQAYSQSQASVPAAAEPVATPVHVKSEKKAYKKKSAATPATTQTDATPSTLQTDATPATDASWTPVSKRAPQTKGAAGGRGSATGRGAGRGASTGRGRGGRGSK